jgi:hypothetical protein
MDDVQDMSGQCTVLEVSGRTYDLWSLARSKNQNFSHKKFKRKTSRETFILLGTVFVVCLVVVWTNKTIQNYFYFLFQHLYPF